MALRTPLSVTPHLYMGDSTGRPLDMGTVYFGEKDKDPEFYPINLFSDDALTLPLMQPVNTKGGYLYDKGDMVEPHAKEIIYSVKVLDSYGRKVFYKGAMMRNSWNDDVIQQINTAIIESQAEAVTLAKPLIEAAIDKAVISSGFITIDSFELGATITQRNEALRHTADGKLYRWAGDLPKVVPANSTPATSGGIAANAWLEVSDTTLRQELSNAGGAAKIGNAKVVFASVNAMSSASWVRIGDKVSTLSYHDGLGYGGGEYVAVASGTSLADGFEYIDGLGLQFKLDLKGQCDVTQAGARGVNDSAAIMAAAAVAKARKLALIAPPIGKMYQLNAPVDLMEIYTVRFSENINTSLITNAIAVTVGGMANSGVPDIRFGALYNGKSFTQPTPAQPVLRVFGAKSGEFEIGSCNYVQIYADAAVAIGNSTAYNRFELNGVIRRLELYGEPGYSWINENQFYRGRIIELHVISNEGYKNNHNLFKYNSFEGTGVELKFINAWENRVEGARFEGVSTKGITFDALSVNNIVETSWTGQASSRNVLSPSIKVVDLGIGNIVTSTDYSKYKMYRAIAMDSNAGLISDGASVSSLNSNIFPQKPNYDFPSNHLALLGLDSFKSGTSNTRIMALTELIPVRMGDILRLTVNATVGGLRPAIEAFDANQKVLAIGGLFEAPSYTYNTTRKYLESSAPFTNGVTTAAVISSQVAYVRLAFYSSAANSVYKSIYWDVFSKSDNRYISPRHGSVMRLATPPTSGIPIEGAVVYSASDTSSYRASNVISVSLDAEVNTTNPAISILSTYNNYFKNGDVVGVALDSGETYWGTVSDKTSTSFKAGALPSIASAGNRLVIINWEKLTVAITP